MLVDTVIDSAGYPVVETIDGADRMYATLRPDGLFNAVDILEGLNLQLGRIGILQCIRRKGMRMP